MKYYYKGKILTMKKHTIIILIILGCIGLMGFSTAINIGIKDMFDQSGRIKQFKLSTGQTYSASAIAEVLSGGGGGGDASYPINLAGGTQTTGVLPESQGGFGTTTPKYVRQTNGSSTGQTATSISINSGTATLSGIASPFIAQINGTASGLTISSGTITASTITVDTLTVNGTVTMGSTENVTGSKTVTVGSGYDYTINVSGGGKFVGTGSTGGADFSGLGNGVALGSATLNYSNLMDSARVRPFGFTDCWNVSAVSPFVATAISSGAISNATGTITAGHPGVAILTGSSTAGSGYRVFTATNSMVIAGGEEFEAVYYPISSTSTVRMGFHDATSNAAPVDGVYMGRVGTLTISGNTANNGAFGTTSTNYTLGTSTWYRSNIIVGSSATSVNYYLYEANTGILLWTDSLTTNIPTNTARGVGFGITCTAGGVTDIEYLDYIAVGWTKDLVR